LTFGEVAARFGVDVVQVRRWVRTEQCPTIREGRRVRIPAAWVDAQSDATPAVGR
jgi:excisionase family DNA binding protein